MPLNSVLTFYQATAPIGWTREAVASTHMLRVVASDTAGGVSSGTDDPILNNKVPTHGHTISGSIANSTSHTHGSVYGGQGLMTSLFSSTGSEAGLQGGTDGWIRSDTTTSSSGIHSHSHTLAVANNVGSNWAPRYMDVILCKRTS